ncbi:MAG: hypothetical protein KKH92_11240 [Firmicutes bacterium]|nr:hypothetical protein [Bacillota bacterium]
MIELKHELINLKDVKDKNTLNGISQLDDNKILLVPVSNFRGREGYTYQEGTTDFFSYLKDNSDKEVKLVFSEYYQENVLHSDWIRITELLITVFVLPIVTNLISNYIWDKINISKKKPSEVKVDLSIKVKKNEKIIDFKYEGDADNLDNALSKIKEIIEDGKNNK